MNRCNALRFPILVLLNAIDYMLFELEIRIHRCGEKKNQQKCIHSRETIHNENSFHPKLQNAKQKRAKRKKKR